MEGIKEAVQSAWQKAAKTNSKEDRRVIWNKMMAQLVQPTNWDSLKPEIQAEMADQVEMPFSQFEIQVERIKNMST